MLSFLRRKVAKKPAIAAQLLSIVDADTAGFVGLIEQLSLGERLMILVGYTVVQPVYFGTLGAARQNGMDFKIDDLIISMGDKYENQADDQINSRRIYWCMMAACLMKIDWSASKNIENGGKIWSSLLTSIEIASGALSHNVIWSDEEKETFLRADANLIMEMMAKLYMPKAYKDSAAIKDICLEKHLFIN
jgi:hypothetical protein